MSFKSSMMPILEIDGFTSYVTDQIRTEFLGLMKAPTYIGRLMVKGEKSGESSFISSLTVVSPAGVAVKAVPIREWGNRYTPMGTTNIIGMLNSISTAISTGVLSPNVANPAALGSILDIEATELLSHLGSLTIGEAAPCCLNLVLGEYYQGNCGCPQKYKSRLIGETVTPMLDHEEFLKEERAAIKNNGWENEFKDLHSNTDQFSDKIADLLSDKMDWYEGLLLAQEMMSYFDAMSMWVFKEKQPNYALGW